MGIQRDTVKKAIHESWKLRRAAKRSWIGYFDGACPNNRGTNGKLLNRHPTRIGAILFRDGEIVCEISKDTGMGTSNTAEYNALIALLEAAIEHNAEGLLVCGDSQLVILQMQGYYRVKKPHLIELHRRARALLASIDDVQFAWIPREQNTVADKLSKAG